MNASASDVDPEDEGPLTYEPEFAYWSQDDEASDSPGAPQASFGGLPDLDNEPVDAALPDIDEPEAPDNEESVELDDELSIDESSGMSFDDDFSTGLEDLDFTDYSDEIEDPVDEPAPESAESESEDDSEFTEGLEPEDDVEPESPAGSSMEDGPEEDEDDESSLGEIAKAAGSAVALGSKTALSALQKIFAKLPLVGKFVTSAVRAGVTLVLLVAVPIALIVVSSAIVRSATEPAETASISLPDNGGVEMSKMVLSDDGKTLTATLTNTGDVIAEATPGAKLKAVSLSNPISWYKRSDVGSCVGEAVTIDIEASTEVTLKCTTTEANAVVEGALK